MGTKVTEFDPFDPKKIYKDLIDRCKAAKVWNIRCIIDESWVGVAPFDMMIEDGVFHCFVIAPTLKDAYVLVSNQLPVVVFLDYKD